MKYKLKKRIYITFYSSYLLFLFINAIFYGQYPIFERMYYMLFPLLLIMILISFVSFLSTAFSLDRLEIEQYKFMLKLHGGYFLLAMLIYRIFFY